MQDVFIGRQPIYDKNLKVMAYELLFRSGEGNHAAIRDGDQATSEVILNTFTEFGLDRIVGEHLAFINLTRGFLLGEHPLPVVHERVVLEILEDTVIDADIIAAVHRLARDGFAIALDDFIYHPDLQPLVDVADYIKLDVLNMDRETVREHVALLRRQPVKLLAEKVETQDDFAFCKELGFDYFQGYFFCKPNIIKGRRTPNNQLSMLRLLSKLNEPDISLDELEALIVQDVALTYRLLRYINSAHTSLNRNVDSIRKALVMLGLNTVRSLASLVALSRVDDKPSELMTMSLVRARMCEQVARRLGEKDSERYFTVGLFSVLDALLDMPMEEVLTSLPLADTLKDALLHHAGKPGEVLRCVTAYDQGLWSEVDSLLDAATLRDIYLESIGWAGGILSEALAA